MPIPELPPALDRFGQIIGLIGSVLDLLKTIQDLLEGPDENRKRIPAILFVVDAILAEVNGMRGVWTATLEDVHYADTDWWPATLTQVQAIRTNVDTNLPVEAAPTTSQVSAAVWGAIIAPGHPTGYPTNAAGLLADAGLVAGQMRRWTFQRLLDAPDFAVGHISTGLLGDYNWTLFRHLDPRARGSQSVVNYLNANDPVHDWVMEGIYAVTEIVFDGGFGRSPVVCLVTDSASSPTASTPDTRIDELLARTEDTAAADDKILAADFTPEDYQDELDELLARTIQTAAADQKILDTDFSQDYAGLVSAEAFTIAGAGVLVIPPGSAGCTVDLVELPANVASFGTDEPVRYRWLGEVAPGLAGRLYKTTYLDYSLNIITDWPRDVDRIRYQLAPGVSATLTVLRPPT